MAGKTTNFTATVSPVAVSASIVTPKIIVRTDYSNSNFPGQGIGVQGSLSDDVDLRSPGTVIEFPRSGSGHGQKHVYSIGEIVGYISVSSGSQKMTKEEMPL